MRDKLIYFYYRHNFVGVNISFWIVSCCNSKRSEVGTFKSFQLLLLLHFLSMRYLSVPVHMLLLHIYNYEIRFNRSLPNFSCKILLVNFDKQNFSRNNFSVRISNDEDFIKAVDKTAIRHYSYYNKVNFDIRIHKDFDKITASDR